MSRISKFLGVCLALLWSLQGFALDTLNPNDKNAVITLSADNLGVSIGYSSLHAGVRSLHSVAPGSGFYYFEGKREAVKRDYGFGVATASVALNNWGGQTDQSVGVNTAQALWYNGKWSGSFSGDQDTYGIAVDYRGTTPIIYVITSSTIGGAGQLVWTRTMPNVTAPLFIYVYGYFQQSAEQQRINAGQAAFTFDAKTILSNAKVSGASDLKLGWPGINANTSPTISISNAAQTITSGQSITLNATSSDAEDGSLTSKIVWSDSASSATASGGSWTVTPSAGNHIYTATVTDSGGLSASITVAISVSAPNSAPSVTISSAAQTVAYGQSVTLSASASDTQDGNLTSKISWTDSASSLTGTGASLLFSSTQLGAHTITARVTDAGGLSGSAQVVITVNDPDTDGDGLTASQEATAGTDAAKVDTDSDSMPDGWEVKYGLRPLVNDAVGDLDADGASNLAEYQAGTLPNDASSKPAASSAGFSVLSATDKHANIVLSTDRLGVRIPAYGSHTGVRSEGGIKPGSGFFYFEGRRLASVRDYGFGVATGAISLTNYGGQTDQSIGVNTSQALWYNATWSGGFSGEQDTYGIAVDYRGMTPIVYAITSTTLGGAGRLIWTRTMPNVTSPLYIYVYGYYQQSAEQQRVNTGQTAFAFDAKAILTAAGVSGASTMTLGWPAPSGSVSNTAPSITLSASAQTIVAGQSITLSASASDAQDGTLTSSISWTDSASSNTATGGSWTVTPSVGTHTFTAKVTDSGGLSSSAMLTVTVQAANTAPSVVIATPAQTLSSGQSITLNATATDSQDGTLTSKISWTDSASSVTATGGSWTLTPSIGTHTFTARVTDAGGLTASASVVISVTAASAGYGLTSRPSLQTLNIPLDPPQLGTVTLGTPFNGAAYSSSALLMIPSPRSDNKLFLMEREGVVKVFDSSQTTPSPSIFLDIASVVASDGEKGLLGMAFDPNYATNHYFYLHYSRGAGDAHQAYISRFTSSADFSSAQASSEKVILRIDQPMMYHQGGSLAFGTDGYLYISVGESEPGSTHSQDMTLLLGKILRIDPNNGNPYAIPADNPYAGNTLGYRQEIYASGFRNPYKMSIDPTDGSIWVGDVGETSWEEVNLVTKGGNYGWPVYEGNHAYDNPRNLPASNFKAPLLEYDHSVGQSVTGGFVYHGTQIPALKGTYIYGDFIQGKVWSLTRNSNGTVTNTLLYQNANMYLAGFGLDAQGEIYTLSFGSGVQKLEAATAGTANAFPALLSQTGLFTDTAKLTPQAGLIEFDVNSPLWTDNAVKKRWLAVPNGKQITFSATGAWQFPVGTVMIKQFDMEMTAGNASTRRRLETRVLVNQNSTGWKGVTYRWNAAQTDATLLENGATETLTITDASAPGGSRQQTYVYPSSSQCLACHSLADGRVLGPRTLQLNKNFAYAASGVTDNQLRALNHAGYFTTDIGDPANYGRYVDINDTSRTLAERSRSYVATNCSFCHQPSGPAPTSIDLRYSLVDADLKAVGISPSAGTLGIANAQIIYKGSKANSVLWNRMNSRATGVAMPPFGSTVIDSNALQVIGSWIDSMQ